MVSIILDYLHAGESREEVLRQYPSIDPLDIDACSDTPPGSPTKKRSIRCTRRSAVEVQARLPRPGDAAVRPSANKRQHPGAPLIGGVFLSELILEHLLFLV